MDNPEKLVTLGTQDEDKKKKQQNNKQKKTKKNPTKLQTDIIIIEQTVNYKLTLQL
jgi:hypothetical protein